MAVAFDTASNGSSTAGGGNISWTHTMGGTSAFYLVVAVVLDAGNTATVTFDSVSMTQIATIGGGTGGSALTTYLFGLLGPSTGAKTVAVTQSGATNCSGVPRPILACRDSIIRGAPSLPRPQTSHRS